MSNYLHFLKLQLASLTIRSFDSRDSTVFGRIDGGTCLARTWSGSLTDDGKDARRRSHMRSFVRIAT
jgi:hypothetical protein